jgi:hypothetical protein
VARHEFPNGVIDELRTGGGDVEVVAQVERHSGQSPIYPFIP